VVLGACRPIGLEIGAFALSEIGGVLGCHMSAAMVSFCAEQIVSIEQREEANCTRCRAMTLVGQNSAFVACATV
jgi:hypothetical protein